jgi:glucose/mannose transport system substrate-binding protein
MKLSAIYLSAGMVGAGLLAAAPNFAHAGEKAEVIHWWTSGSEAAAVKVLADAFDKAGGEWVDNAVAGGGGDKARALGINRIVGGNAPTAMQFNYGKQLDEVIANGYVRDISALAKEGDWKNLIPAELWNSITVDGKVYGVPIDVHGQTWSWWSLPALKKAGAEVPQTWDAFFPTLDKLKAAGIIPIAVSRDPWTIDSMWRFLVISKGGTELFKKIYVEHDANAVKSPAFKDLVETLIKMRGYSDQGASARNWNDSTALVINDKAGVQFMGDWAKGEFLKAGKKPTEDFACTPVIGSNKGYVYGGDMFIMTATNSADVKKSQDLLVKTMMSKDVQVDFNKVKGGIPVRNDVDTSKLDDCAKTAINLMATPENQVGDQPFYNSTDTIGAIRDLLGTFWASPNPSVDDFTQKFASIISAE